MTSAHLKCAVMAYFRFRRGFVCADEVGSVVRGNADVLVDTGKEILEIEIKTSKSDLINGEAKKAKHERIKLIDENKNYINWTPNKFYICVPGALEGIAQQWIETTNPKYGLILYKDDHWQWERKVFIRKTAKSLRESYNRRAQEHILRRLCSSVITTMQRRLTNEQNSYLHNDVLKTSDTSTSSAICFG